MAQRPAALSKTCQHPLCPGTKRELVVTTALPGVRRNWAEMRRHRRKRARMYVDDRDDDDDDDDDDTIDDADRPVGSSTGLGPPHKIGFEDLPPETRLMVYEYLFVLDHPIRPLCHEDRHMEPPGAGRPPALTDIIPLLRVSRLVHAEAGQVLYARNAFILYARDYGDAMVGFLRQIGATNRRTIRKLELDWQHGIVKANQVSKAHDLFGMVDDLNNPLRNEVAKMLHDVSRATIARFVAALDLVVANPRLERLTLLSPGTDNPGHPDRHATDFQVCCGCHREVPRALARFRNVVVLTVGDTDCLNDLEDIARGMGVQELNVTQVDCIELSPEKTAELVEQGWTMAVTWRDPDGEDFRRVLTKHFPLDRAIGGSSRKRKRW